jgi:hypothetical protein
VNGRSAVRLAHLGKLPREWNAEADRLVRDALGTLG